MPFHRLRQQIKSEQWGILALELAVVVVGIFLGLQVTEWNENRVRRIEFEAAVERVYTAAKKDRFKIAKDRSEYRDQIRQINRLLEAPATIPDEQLLPTLFYLDLPGVEAVPLPVSTIGDQAAVLLRNANSPVERELANQVGDYVSSIGVEQGARFMANHSNVRTELIGPLLTARGIAQPTMIWGQGPYSNFNDFWAGEPPWAGATATARSMLMDGQLEAPLRMLVTRKLQFGNKKFQEIQAVESLMEKIRAAYPDVQLQFSGMGIVGTALAGVPATDAAAAECTGFAEGEPCLQGWTDSIPMNRVAGSAAQWTLDVRLQDGFLKFRTRNSWEENWGGGQFPSGQAVWYGEDIPVTAGHYRVTIDLDAETYEFLPLPGG